MNKIRLAAFAILFVSITFVDWCGDKIAYGGYLADKFPTGWTFYAVPAAFFIGTLSAMVLTIDALSVFAKWIMSRFAKTEKAAKADKVLP